MFLFVKSRLVIPTRVCLYFESNSAITNCLSKVWSTYTIACGLMTCSDSLDLIRMELNRYNSSETDGSMKVDVQTPALLLIHSFPSQLAWNALQSCTTLHSDYKTRHLHAKNLAYIQLIYSEYTKQAYVMNTLRGCVRPVCTQFFIL